MSGKHYLQIKKINLAVFLIVLVALSILTFISFIAAGAQEEGMKTSLLLAGLFSMLRFPIHTLLWDFISNSSAGIYFGGLFIYVILYTFLGERIYTLLSIKSSQ